MRDIEDPTYVFIDLEFETEGEAKAMVAAMRKVWSRVQGKVIWDPTARIVEVAERKVLPDR